MMIRRRTSRPLKRNGAEAVPAKKSSFKDALKRSVDPIVDKVNSLADRAFDKAAAMPTIGTASKVGRASLSDDKYMRSAQILATLVGMPLQAVGIYNLIKKSKSDPKALDDLQKLVSKAEKAQLTANRRTSRGFRRNAEPVSGQPKKTSLKDRAANYLKGKVDPVVEKVNRLGDSALDAAGKVRGLGGASRLGKSSLSNDKYMRAAQILAVGLAASAAAVVAAPEVAAAGVAAEGAAAGAAAGSAAFGTAELAALAPEVATIYSLIKKSESDPQALKELNQLVDEASMGQLKKNRATSRASVHDPALAREFNRLINMSGAEIRAWAKDPRSKDASFPHIRAELPLLAQMKDTSPSHWTPKMWDKAMRAVNFVKRHEAQMKKQGAEYGTGKYHATHKRIVALLNWGRRTPGVNIAKAVGSKKLQPNERWGRLAAGALIVARSTGRVLLTFRSAYVNEPHTWGLPGGRCEGEDQDTLECAIRETREETSYRGPLSAMREPIYTYTEPGFKFDNYLAFSDDEFKCKLDWENEDYGWFSLDELPEPMHFGLQTLLAKAGAKITREIANGGQG